MAANLDQELDRLYGVELDRFTHERNALAKRLRDEGRHKDADAVKALKKPSVSAWTVNQLAQRRRKDVDLLLDAGHRIREAQRGVLTGKERAAFDEARRRQQRALDALRDAAKELGASGATLERVSRTLHAAGVVDEGRELLARGRFTTDLTLTGFEAVAELGVTPTPRRKQTKKTAPKRDLVKKARADVAEARKRRRAAQNELERAQRELDARNAELEAAEDRLRQTQRRS